MHVTANSMPLVQYEAACEFEFDRQMQDLPGLLQPIPHCAFEHEVHSGGHTQL